MSDIQIKPAGNQPNQTENSNTQATSPPQPTAQPTPGPIRLDASPAPTPPPPPPTAPTPPPPPPTAPAPTPPPPPPPPTAPTPTQPTPPLHPSATQPIKPLNTSEQEASLDKTQNDHFKSLRQAALLFFILIGTSHIITGLMASNSLYLPMSNAINRMLDIPFAVIAVVYGISNWRIPSDSKFKKSFLALMIISATCVLLILLYINIFIPDRLPT